MVSATRNILLFAGFALFVSATFATSAEPLDKRLDELKKAITAKPDAPERMFHPTFLEQISKAQITEILTQYHEVAGTVARITQTKSKGNFYGEYRFATDRQMVFSVKLGVDQTPPHLITTVWFGPIQPGLKSADDALAKFKSLPGQVSVAFARLGDGDPSIVHALNPDLSLAIGSTFKLYVLGALMRETDKGKLGWDAVVTLRDESKSLPSGILQDWPAGSPLTLQTLATQMISISDNTATDHLLLHLGRPTVEKMLGTMGHGKPTKNLPFLTTREMFMIKETGHAAERIEAYSTKNLKQRRKYLGEVIGKMSLADFAGIDLAEPTGIDKVEWFASANDLTRAMDWIRRNSKPEDAARNVLSVNPGLAFDEKIWSFVGYKGGSETGVLNLTWLLGRRDGQWFALSAGWNNTEKSLNKTEFFGLVQGFIDQVSTLEPKP